jgi:hypothetical protein
MDIPQGFIIYYRRQFIIKNMLKIEMLTSSSAG